MHTPGPWIVDPDDRNGMEWNIHIVLADKPHHRICFMASDGPNKENARLIAAAPDMLAALRAVADSDLRCEVGVDHECPLDLVRAAIAKAEGMPLPSAE